MDTEGKQDAQEGELSSGGPSCGQGFTDIVLE